MKTITFLICLVISAKVFCQDTLKAVPGNISTELNVNILQGELSFNNSLNQVKIRYFETANRCHRFGVKISSDNYKETGKSVYGVSPNEIEFKSNKFGVAFNYGIEWHLKGTKRLSPYIGFDLNFTDTWYKLKYKVNDYQITYTNLTINTQEISTSSNQNIDDLIERASFSLGADLIMGFDYYISRNIFLGYEFNYGPRYIKYKEMKMKEVTSDEDYDGLIDIPDENDKHEFTFSPKLYNGIRLGFIF